MNLKKITGQTSVGLCLALIAQAGFAADAKFTTAGKSFDKGMEAKGMKYGSLLVIPKVEVSEVYDDNIYATENNAKHDLITRIRPSVEVVRDTKSDYVSALARLDINRYAAKKDESTAGYLASLYGAHDFNRMTGVSGKLSYSRQFEDRGDPNSPANSAKPVVYNYGLARAGLTHKFTRALDVKVGTEARSYDYQDSYTQGGAFINNEGRDRTDYIQSAQVRYKLNRSFSPFVRGTLDNRVYDRKAPTNRSSQGGSVVAGTEFTLRPSVKGEAFAGVQHRDYHGATYKDIPSTPDFGGNVTWNVDETFSLMGTIDRSVEETTRSLSSAYVETSYALDAEKKLNDSLLLTGGLSRTINSYRGNSANQRHDNYWDGYVGVKHYLSKGVSVAGEYSYRQRSSNIAGGDYDNNKLMLKLSLGY